MPESETLDRERLLDTAVAAARAGGEVLMQYLREGVRMRNKSSEGGKSYDLVSDADIDSEKAIANLIRSRHPTHDLLGEEALSLDDTNVADLWIIDPLDGTNNYAHRVPQFSVSIAYYHQGLATVAAVLNPARDELFTATRGGGAFCNDTPAHVSDASSLSETLIGCGFYYDRGDMMRSTLSSIEDLFGHHIHGIRRFGSAALDLCSVGCGQFGGYFEYQLSPWDFAAGRLFVEEAGGKVSTARGDDLPLASSSVLASNGRLHNDLLSITSRHHPQ
tara:strand:- start:148487 stop:149314 length:828 start_codon:yes stop_codon:yes gene_type:complete